jgi:hypothetical protein
VASYGNINLVGFGTQNASQGLNGPYSAYVIGEYIGITPPFAEDDQGQQYKLEPLAQKCPLLTRGAVDTLV